MAEQTDEEKEAMKRSMLLGVIFAFGVCSGAAIYLALEIAS
ncbi:hypothetical protein WSK_2678 [Novosphingobium sp. Rr 2-17]|nr:hypothetical protein [Novosphingobium sp. Rr 2-17]EIZ78630.1 hypothetical protein WSK_2678 [Novosphingobium sp. Rr 2-17]